MKINEAAIKGLSIGDYFLSKAKDDEVYSRPEILAMFKGIETSYDNIKYHLSKNSLIDSCKLSKMRTVWGVNEAIEKLKEQIGENQ
jgi:hypothetical protein